MNKKIISGSQDKWVKGKKDQKMLVARINAKVHSRFYIRCREIEIPGSAIVEKLIIKYLNGEIDITR